MNEHEKFMRLALKLALKAKGKTSPNPMVGALVVKDGRIVGKGYHKDFGGPHAEVFALGQAKDRARGSTLYVTLEPCFSYGKTPPCTEKIIESGIKEVVVGAVDPNPLNHGRGIKKLESKGIKTVVGVLEGESNRLNEVFTKYITTRRPFVTVKVAQSLDGKIATKAGDSKWITGETARRYVHKIRGKVDAILVGVDTVIKDDPLLTTRNLSAAGCLPQQKDTQPIKVIVDSRLRTPCKAKIFSGDSPSPVIIATTRYAPKEKIGKFEARGAKVLIIKDRNGRVDLKTLMKELGKLEIAHLLIEGGGEVIASAVEQRLVDKALFFIASKIVGGRDAISSVEGGGIKKMERAIRLRDVKIKKLGEDILVEGYLGS